MPNYEHIKILKSGVKQWNMWRFLEPAVVPDLSDADLSDLEIGGIDLRYANLQRTNLSESDLNGGLFDYADLTESKLNFCDLTGASFESAKMHLSCLMGIRATYANFRNAQLSQAFLAGAILTEADLSGSDLSGAFLAGVQFVRSKLQGANISGCNVYGISVWDTDLTNCVQESLIITPEDSGETVTVDNIKVAQFMYLILNNKELQSFIDSSSRRVVLILGRFTDDRKLVLDRLRESLRGSGYVPVLFDFDQPKSRSITETVTLLAHLSKFIVADITEAKSIPQELRSIIPSLPSVFIIPIILKGHEPYSMFKDFSRYPWVKPLIEYEETKIDDLLRTIIDATSL